jgi:hypothetical protein
MIPTEMCGTTPQPTLDAIRLVVREELVNSKENVNG